VTGNLPIWASHCGDWYYSKNFTATVVAGHGRLYCFKLLPSQEHNFFRWPIYIPGTKNWPSCPWAYCTIAPPAVVAFVIVSVWSPCTVSPWLAIWIAPAGITTTKQIQNTILHITNQNLTLLVLKPFDDHVMHNLRLLIWTLSTILVFNR
jgi:hypothetical protein